MAKFTRYDYDGGSQVVHADSNAYLRTRKDLHEMVPLVIADPPYNIGMDYPDYDDRRPADEFRNFLSHLCVVIERCLTPGGAVYFFMSDEHVAYVYDKLEWFGLEYRNWLIWHYTFGVHTKAKFCRSKVHILYFVKPGGTPQFHRDRVIVPSARQIVYKDRRAAAGGKTPHDVWALLPDQEVERFNFPADVLLESRVCGTFDERSSLSNQLPERLIERLILVSSNPGDLVLDPVAGTGTTPAVAQRLGRRFLAVELAKPSVEAIRARLAAQPGGERAVVPPPSEAPCKSPKTTSRSGRRPKSAR